MELHAEPQTSLHVLLPGFAFRTGGQTLSTPISRELLSAMEKGLTHRMILTLFRDTLELTPPYEIPAASGTFRKEKALGRSFPQ